jgi:protein ImuB
VPVRPVEPVAAEWSFSEPVADRQALAAVLRILLEQLATALVARQQGIQRLVCRLLCTGRRSVDLTVGVLCPQVSAAHLEELLNLQLERAALPGEVQQIRLEAISLGPIEVHQELLFAETLFAERSPRDAQRELAVLFDRLSNRLGADRVLRPRLVPDPQPECASRWEPVLEQGEKSPAQKSAAISAGEKLPAAARPLWLSPQPQPIAVVSLFPAGPPIRFSWGGRDQIVRQFWGPERIETGWWRGPHVERDYYRVETTTGQRFWLFRRQTAGAWFLHGVFD